MTRRLWRLEPLDPVSNCRADFADATDCDACGESGDEGQEIVEFRPHEIAGGMPLGVSTGHPTHFVYLCEDLA